MSRYVKEMIMNVIELKAKGHIAIAGNLFFDGEPVFVEGGSHRRSGCSVDLWRVYNSDREYVGDIGEHWFDTGLFEKPSPT